MLITYTLRSTSIECDRCTVRATTTEQCSAHPKCVAETFVGRTDFVLFNTYKRPRALLNTVLQHTYLSATIWPALLVISVVWLFNSQKGMHSFLWMYAMFCPPKPINANNVLYRYVFTSYIITVADTQLHVKIMQVDFRTFQNSAVTGDTSINQDQISSITCSRYSIQLRNYSAVTGS